MQTQTTERICSMLRDSINENIQLLKKLEEKCLKLEQDINSTPTEILEDITNKVSSAKQGINQLETLVTSLQTGLGSRKVNGVNGIQAKDVSKALVAPTDSMVLCYRTLIDAINEDVGREGLLKTPHRAAKAFLELTVGYRQDLKTLINEAVYQTESDEMVIVKDIELYSLCEHHLLPFMGKCHVGYIPKGKVIGLSKIARIVDYFARRLQIQENLTYQIATCLEEAIGAAGVTVVIEAEHMCMRMRGVGKQNSLMKTSASVGVMKENSGMRGEFLKLIYN